MEYKRGKPKSRRADEVQLCAQALCLEEMLGTVLPRGFLFYGGKRRRTDSVRMDHMGSNWQCQGIRSLFHGGVG